VSRAARQMLKRVVRRPLVHLDAVNPALFRYVVSLTRMRTLRQQILAMKCYFVCCKVETYK
jgi:hypothetical protein